VPRTGNGTIEEDVGNEDAESSYENSNKFPSTNLAAQGSQSQFTVLKRLQPDQSPSQIEHNPNTIIEEDAEYQHDPSSNSKHKSESKRIRTNSKSPANDSPQSQDELRKFHAQETPEPNPIGQAQIDGRIPMKDSLNEYKGEMRAFEENMVKKLHTWELNRKSAKFVKDNFQDLSILGQFNTGFIVTFFERGQNYYIIDQHASDEKFKYEGFIFSENVNNPKQQELVNLVK
jgi:DNA mismatch repair ATPase MutL